MTSDGESDPEGFPEPMVSTYEDSLILSNINNSDEGLFLHHPLEFWQSLQSLLCSKLFGRNNGSLLWVPVHQNMIHGQKLVQIIGVSIKSMLKTVPKDVLIYRLSLDCFTIILEQLKSCIWNEHWTMVDNFLEDTFRSIWDNPAFGECFFTIV